MSRQHAGHLSIKIQALHKSTQLLIFSTKEVVHSTSSLWLAEDIPPAAYACNAQVTGYLM